MLMDIQDFYLDNLNNIYKKYVLNASLGHYQKSYQRYDFNNQNIFYIISYMTKHYNVIYKGKKINQPIIILFKPKKKSTFQN